MRLAPSCLLSNFLCQNFYHFSCSPLPRVGAPLLQPAILVRDGGSPSNNVTCNLNIRVYDFVDTVTVVLIGGIDDFDQIVFEQLLSTILGVEVHVTRVTQDNTT